MNVYLRAPRNRVSPRAVRWWFTRTALIVLPLPCVLLVLFALLPPARPVFGWLTVAFAVPALAWLAVEPWWRWRVHRWEVTADAVYVASGWLWQRWRVVPLTRVQAIDTVRGPLQQLFGLTGVSVTAAVTAGSARIVGLDHRFATDLVDQLTAATAATTGVAE
nr:PH domain-containing protein [Kibdelosporangium sp. MJ126-NF4]CEL15544.1 transmembrane protein, distant homology with ydbS [Kibdelosporangium sp. MJ126-NF4]CTQ98210.1 transmembrane protein, distant homology with ydbS [Kibdelosporangium sp. MJ126-NF4]